MVCMIFPEKWNQKNKNFVFEWGVVVGIWQRDWWWGSAKLVLGLFLLLLFGLNF